MDYQIERQPSFSVIGMEKLLTHKQSQNIIISQSFWPVFNQMLKKNYLTQHGNWVKYAFTYVKGEAYFYCPAIPFRHTVPEGFIKIDIDEQEYMVVEHRGEMSTIYNTYNKIYKEILPQALYSADNKQFFHFEKYTDRFQWNRKDSVIEIWVPIKEKNFM